MSQPAWESHLTAVTPAVRALRQDLHAHPELAYEEHRTAGKVAEWLEALPHATVETGIAGTGVTATFAADKPGPAVALRADMDALPLNEISGVPYSSQTPGKMHACGHDGHTAMLLGAATVLNELVDELQGPVKLLFQPAEEGGAGAEKMVQAGVLNDPPIAAVFGLHNMPDPETHVGQIALCEGPAMAGTGIFTIKLEGKGGHAALPHGTRDPIVAGSHLVTALQTIVSRHTDPVKSAVVSVTQFHAGTAFNVIPQSVEIKGTIRALEPEVLQATADQVHKLCEGVAATFGMELSIDLPLGYPPLINDPQTNAYFREVVASLGRTDDLVTVPPIMGGEDFAFMNRAVPGTFFFLPARPADVAAVPFCHHPAFDFNDALIPDGIRLHVALALQFAGKWTSAS